jgi:hypothetical protein
MMFFMIVLALAPGLAMVQQIAGRELRVEPLVLDGRRMR